MPSPNAQMVKLPRELVVRIDAVRGDATRPAFLDALLAMYEKGINAGPQRVASSEERRRRDDGPTAKQVHDAARQSRPRRGGDSPRSCPHPVGSRIGGGCALCGATGLK